MFHYLVLLKFACKRAINRVGKKIEDPKLAHREYIIIHIFSLIYLNYIDKLPSCL